ncbi:hypothetical protein [Geodermatophilus sp. SYSU D01119]
MQPVDHLALLARRWGWLVLAVVAGALLGAGSGALAPPVYEARAGVYVTAARLTGPADPAHAARVRDDVLPSVAALVGGASVTAELREDTNVLDLTVSAPDPDRAVADARAVVAALEARAEELLAGDDGPLVTVTLVDEPRRPSGPAGPAVHPALLGGAAGGAAAVLVLGLLQLARPRLTTTTDVLREARVPLLAELPSGGGLRATGLDRLRSALGGPAGAGPLVAGPAPAAGRLAAELGGRALGPRHRPGDAGTVVAVVDARSTTLAELRRSLADLTGRGLEPAGVVVDGLLPPRPGLRARLRAGLRGEASWQRAARPAGAGAAAVDRAVAGAAVAALGFTKVLPMGLTTGLVAVLALLPVWAPVAARQRGVRVLAALTGVALLSGVALALRGTGRGLSLHEAVTAGGLVVTLAGGVGLVLWARTLLPLPAVGVAFALGQVATGLLRVEDTANVYKFAVAVPLTVLVLALLGHRHRPWVAAAALGGLGVLAVANDSRSQAGFCVVAAALVLWQARPGTASARSPWSGLALLGGAVAGGYLLLAEVLTSGLLGADAAARTAEQVARSGSLLLGGRPEWTATWALAQQDPLGFGLGAVPSSGDVLVAEAGMAVARIPTAEGYIQNYLLAGRFELHSVVADLWAATGPAGLAVGVLLAVLLVRGAARLSTQRQAPPLVCFLVPLSLWYLAFGPLQTNGAQVAVTLGLVLAALPAVRPEPVDRTPSPVPAPRA